MKKVLIVVNIPKFFLSHWLGIAATAKAAGYQVHVATMAGPEVAKIHAAGLIHHEIPMSRSGTNVWRELKSLWAVIRLFRQVKPDLVHLITIKPVIYGGIAARLTGVKAVLSAVTGLGYVFINQQGNTLGLKRVISALYTYVFGHRNIRVLFENDSDRDSFCQSGIVKPQRTVVVHGAGVDEARVRLAPLPDHEPVINGGALPADDRNAALLLPAGRQGPAFLVFRNYDAIFSYNAAESYALAIALLADRLRGDAGLQARWPTDDPGLSRAERRELQSLLVARGHDIGEVDGMLGDKSRVAIRAEQTRMGQDATGRAGQKLLKALRGG